MRMNHTILEALAVAEDTPFALYGAERIAAYWVLGICSAAFVDLSEAPTPVMVSSLLTVTAV